MNNCICAYSTQTSPQTFIKLTWMHWILLTEVVKTLNQFCESEYKKIGSWEAISLGVIITALLILTSESGLFSPE